MEVGSGYSKSGPLDSLLLVHVTTGLSFEENGVGSKENPGIKHLKCAR
jgi:hypothetical protein